MNKLGLENLNDTLVAAPSLHVLTGRRAEFTHAPEIWSQVLEPELNKREAARKAAIQTAVVRTILGGGIPIFVIVLLAISSLVPVRPLLQPAILIAVVGAGLASATAWIKVFTMKSQTKYLVLSAACEPFGFTYDTLHPDLSGISDFSSLVAQASALSKTSFGKVEASIDSPFGALPIGSSNAHDAPTPAYAILRDAKLLPGHSRRKFEDLITGERAGTRFALVEAKLETGGKNSKVVFQGILVHVEYPERFQGRTVMARSGWWKRGKQSGELKRVHLVSQELEDAFTVYSTDQVEARALLSPDRMERLIALERHFSGGKLRGVFEDGHMTLALEAKDQFEAGSIFAPLVDSRRFASALVELGLVCDLVDGFLTRDWVQGRI